MSHRIWWSFPVSQVPLSVISWSQCKYVSGYPSVSDWSLLGPFSYTLSAYSVGHIKFVCYHSQILGTISLIFTTFVWFFTRSNCFQYSSTLDNSIICRSNSRAHVTLNLIDLSALRSLTLYVLLTIISILPTKHPVSCNSHILYI